MQRELIRNMTSVPVARALQKSLQGLREIGIHHFRGATALGVIAPKQAFKPQSLVAE